MKVSTIATIHSIGGFVIKSVVSQAECNEFKSLKENNARKPAQTYAGRWASKSTALALILQGSLCPAR